MLMDARWIKVHTYAADSTYTKEYNALDIERIVRELAKARALSVDPDWALFLESFAVALDVVASGLLSSEFPVGTAIRAFVDMKDPDEMPGMITDVGRWFEHDDPDHPREGSL